MTSDERETIIEKLIANNIDRVKNNMCVSMRILLRFGAKGFSNMTDQELNDLVEFYEKADRGE